MSASAIGSSSPLLTEPPETNASLDLCIWVDAARMHGEPCFRGTRVPVKILFDHLRAGDPVSEFLKGFPDVTRDGASQVIDLAAMGLLERLLRR